MNFQEKMNEIMEHWEKYPIPNHIKDNDQSSRISTVEGILTQLNELPPGVGIITVALMDINNPSLLKTETIMVTKE